MTKTKLTLGILLIVFGGIISMIGMLYGIKYNAENLYEDLFNFPVKLEISQGPLQPLREELRTNSFSVKSEDSISIWLKVPDKRIRNKDFIITVSMRKQTGEIIAKFEQNFNPWHWKFRNTSGQASYFRLGKYYFDNDANIYLSYSTGGTWDPPYDGALVIRRSKPFPIPLKEIAVFIFGSFIWIIGIRTIARRGKTLKRGGN